MSTKKLQLLGQLGEKIYKQNEEPLDVPDGSLWVDMDEEGGSGSGSAGVSSWNDLTDKPFGDFSDGGDTVTWDEIMDGKINADGEFFKVSDALPTESDFANGYVITFADGSVSNYVQGGMQSTGSLLLEQGLNFAVVYDPEAATESSNWSWPETGVYLYYCDPYVKSLTINGYTGFEMTKKIDKKYLPETLPEITAETEGAFLCVVNGEATWQVIPDAEGVGF